VFVRLLVLLAHGVFAVFFPLAVLAEATFSVRLNLALCPEYRRGGVTLEVNYRSSPGGALSDAPIASQSIDAAANTAVLEIVLPATFGTTSLEVLAFCRSASGLGHPSAAASISFCSVLSTRDSDGDGAADSSEDLDCSGSFTAGDASNLFLWDSDGDGVNDSTELDAHTNPLNPASTPRPLVLLTAVFDPDGDGNSNPLFFRHGEWQIADYPSHGQSVTYHFGEADDLPFTFEPRKRNSDIGVVRREGNVLVWYFHGAGLELLDSSALTHLAFGQVGDLIVPGPWEEAGVTNPAVARLVGERWIFSIYRLNRTTRTLELGVRGDLPRAGDFDGDGRYDAAVYRASDSTLYFIRSTDGTTGVIATGLSPEAGLQRFVPVYPSPCTAIAHDTAQSLLNYYRVEGSDVCAIVDHGTATRSYHPANDPAVPTVGVQWGQAGDHLG
jgi:hypothetical protein